MIDFQRYFLVGRRAELRRLARFTGQPLEELEQEAAVMAMELQSLSSDPPDFSSPEVQDEILARLRQRFERVRRQSRRHVSLDQPLAGSERQSTLSLVDLVPADEHSDPLRALLRTEDRKRLLDQFLEACRTTYSQFVAYLILLWHCGAERKEAADYLAIAPATFDSRMARAKISLGIQASLFDGVSSLSMDFRPLRGSRKTWASVRKANPPAGQLLLFEANAVPAMIITR